MNQFKRKYDNCYIDTGKIMMKCELHLGSQGLVFRKRMAITLCKIVCNNTDHLCSAMVRFALKVCNFINTFNVRILIPKCITNLKLSSTSLLPHLEIKNKCGKVTLPQTVTNIPGVTVKSQVLDAQRPWAGIPDPLTGCMK